MPRFFKLKPSRTELHVVYGLLLLAAALTCVYVDYRVPQMIYLLAIVLLAVAETSAVRRARAVYLCIDGTRCGLVHRTAGQPYFAVKNKVYQTRWFAILRLCYRRKNQIVMLLPDCFESAQDYQDCRYLLSGQVAG